MIKAYQARKQAKALQHREDNIEAANTAVESMLGAYNPGHGEGWTVRGHLNANLNTVVRLGRLWGRGVQVRQDHDVLGRGLQGPDEHPTLIIGNDPSHYREELRWMTAEERNGLPAGWVGFRGDASERSEMQQLGTRDTVRLTQKLADMATEGVMLGSNVTGRVTFQG